MALHGDNAVIGAVADDVGANVNQGSAYVFTREAGVWSKQEKLTQSDGDAGDEFGLSTPLDEDTAIVGAYRDNIGSNVDQGSAYVFVGFGAVQRSRWIPRRRATPWIPSTASQQASLTPLATRFRT